MIAVARLIARIESHDRRAAWLDRHVGPEFHALVWSTFPSVMGAHIASVRGVEARRAMLQSVPQEIAGVPIRSRTEMFARLAFRRRG